MTRGGRIALVVTAVWSAAAVAVGRSVHLDSIRGPAMQAVLVGLTVAAATAFLLIAPLRAWAASVNARVLIAAHLTRWVGVYFLYLHQRGRLPFAFAVPGGWGDMVVAIGATALMTPGGAERAVRRRLIFAWNVVGLVDILWVVATAARLGASDPGSMRELALFPLNLLPLLVVPVILVTHGIMLARARSLSS